MRTEKCHFWIGKFDSENLYFDFVGEDGNQYELADDEHDEHDEDEEDEDEDDEVPVSKFAESQGEIWIDHDFMESGFEEPSEDLRTQFRKYSYSQKWGTELERRCSKFTKSDINTLIFINEDQISKPDSVSGDGYYLHYLGTIEYEI